MSLEINEEIKKIIEENPVAFATVDISNNPNVIAVADVKVVSKDQIISTDNFMKQTKDNLAKNSHVCLTVWNKDLKGYKLIGTAEYFDSGQWRDYVNKIPENKGYPAKGAVLIKLTKIIPLRQKCS